MFSIRAIRTFSIGFAAILMLFLALGPSTNAFQSGRRPNTSAEPQKKKDQQKPDEPVPPPPDTASQKPGDIVKLETKVVNVDVVVRDKKTGGIYSGLKKGNFKIFEDGVEQEIANFNATEGRLTLVLAVDNNARLRQVYASNTSFESLFSEIIRPTALFLRQFVKPDDYIAIISFHHRTVFVTDFTNNSSDLYNGLLSVLRDTATFSESDIFDAIAFALQGGTLENKEYRGLQEVEGRTALLLITQGQDTFSRINYDQTRKIIQNAGVPIYIITAGNMLYYENDYALRDDVRMSYLQSRNQLQTFAEESGGVVFNPKFPGEIPADLDAISKLLRNQYSLGYVPSNTRAEGKKRKIQVLVDVDNDGKEDSKKTELQYRRGYMEPKSDTAQKGS